MKMESEYIWKGNFFKWEAYCAGANCVCMVEWLNMPWRSFSAFHQGLLIIGNPEMVCVSWCEWRDLKSAAFSSAVHRQKRGQNLPVFCSRHGLQLGHISYLHPDEQALEEVTEVGILSFEFFLTECMFFFNPHLRTCSLTLGTGEGREREKERSISMRGKYWSAVSGMHSEWDLRTKPQSRHVPWPGIKLAALQFMGWCSHQLSHTSKGRSFDIRTRKDLVNRSVCLCPEQPFLSPETHCLAFP